MSNPVFFTHSFNSYTLLNIFILFSSINSFLSFTPNTIFLFISFIAAKHHCIFFTIQLLNNHFLSSFIHLSFSLFYPFPICFSLFFSFYFLSLLVSHSFFIPLFAFIVMFLFIPFFTFSSTLSLLFI